MFSEFKQELAFMQAAHRSIGQKRRDGIRDYEVHPMDVFARLWRAGVRDRAILSAALFHDIPEDVYPLNPFYSLSLITQEFGVRVGIITDELTDRYTKENYPQQNRRVRKQLERERYATFLPETQLVKLGDIGSNLSDETDDAGFMGMYVREKSLCLPYLAMKLDRTDEFREPHALLWEETTQILEATKAKFGVR